MRLFLAFLALSTLFLEGRVCQVSAAASAPDNGLGGDIEWIAWADAKQVAREKGKPLMVIVHKSYCPACKSLKSWFSKSNRIQALSLQFVMVNIEADSARSGVGEVPELDVDGRYVPRVLFLLPEDGQVLTEVVNDTNGNENYKYFYYDEQSLFNSMISVLQRKPVSKAAAAADNEEKQEL